MTLAKRQNYQHEITSSESYFVPAEQEAIQHAQKVVFISHIHILFAVEKTATTNQHLKSNNSPTLQMEKEIFLFDCFHIIIIDLVKVSIVYYLKSHEYREKIEFIH